MGCTDRLWPFEMFYPGTYRYTGRAGDKMSVLRSWLGLAATALALLLSLTSAQAVTCEEVRRLNATELAHWAQRLQVSPSYLAQLLDKAFCDLKPRSDREMPDYNRSMDSL
jgi:hypothetical protein